MPTKKNNRYGAFGNSLTRQTHEENHSKRKTESHEEAHAGEKIKTLDKTSGKRASLPQYKDTPQLYSTGPDGKRTINQNYDTSIGSDMLAGAGLAVRNAQSNPNPFYQLGAALGGLGGGAMNKNLAGKMRHKQDVARTEQENKQIDMRTEATIRAEQVALAAKREQRISENQLWTQEFRKDQQNQKNAEARIKRNLQLLETEADPERRSQIVSALNSDNVPVSDSGTKKTHKVVGDFMFVGDSRGNWEVAVDKETGQPISSLTTKTYLDILKKAQDLEEYEEGSLQKAIDEAKKLAKGLPKANAAHILNIAKTLLKEQGKGTGKVTIGGEVHEIEIPQILDRSKLNPNQEGGSQFMPPLDSQNQPVVDAKTGETVRDESPQYNQYNGTSEPHVNPDVPRTVTPEEFNSLSDKFIELVPKLPKQKQKLLNDAIGKMKEGDTGEVTEMVGRVKRTFIIQKLNGKPTIISIK